MAKSLRQYFFVAVLTAPHGIKGELKLKLLSDLPDRLAGLAEVWLFSRDGKTQLGRKKILALRGAAHEIIKLEQVDDRDAAEKLKGCFLAVSRQEAYPLSDGQYFVDDLLGLKVRDRNRGEIGVLQDALDNPAQPILLIRRPGKKDLLLPLNQATLEDVDFEEEVIKVNLPEGLWEVYE